MSYAIIRNTKYKRENLKGIFRHNERRNRNYSNNNIDKEKSYLNYSIKSPQYSYEKEFEQIRNQYNLKGQIKVVSNIACEYIITSDKEFFETIGEEETKRYFETAYKFVSEYKNLGEQYILSAKVHMDEQSPHMHLIFLPVVHTKDKKGNDIDKLYKNNLLMHKELLRQAKMVEKAEKCQNERDKIMADNRELHNQVENIQAKYKEKELNMEWKYKSKIKSLEKENNYLHKVVDKFYETVEKFIDWICQKFGIGESKELVREFEKETRTYLDAEKQIKCEDREKEFEIEL